MTMSDPTMAPPERHPAPASGDEAQAIPDGEAAVRDLPPVTERELAARARGLASAYIDGGDDPELERTKRQEARYLRLLIGMIVLIVGSSIVITIVGLAVAGAGQ